MIDRTHTGNPDDAEYYVYDSEGNRIRIHGITTRGSAITSTGRLARDFYLFKDGDWLRTDLLQETERQLGGGAVQRHAVVASMKGRPIQSGDGGHGDHLSAAKAASMKGRPIKSSDVYQLPLGIVGATVPR